MNRIINSSLIFSVALVVLSFLLTGCVGMGIVHGSGQVTEQDRQVSSFHAVTLANFGTLHIQVGRQESLHIEGEKNLLPYITTQVRDGVLVIDTKPNTVLRNTRPMHYYLTVQDLDSLKLSGSGEIFAPELDADNFGVVLSGSGDIDLAGMDTGQLDIKISGSGNMQLAQVQASRLNVKISGSGDLNIEDGETQEQNVTISGSGKYGAKNVSSDKAAVHISGSGRANILVQDHLDVRVSGSGDVDYAGQPAMATKITGSGTIRHIDG